MGPRDMFECIYQIKTPKYVRLASWDTGALISMDALGVVFHMYPKERSDFRL